MLLIFYVNIMSFEKAYFGITSLPFTADHPLLDIPSSLLMENRLSFAHHHLSGGPMVGQIEDVNDGNYPAYHLACELSRDAVEGRRGLVTQVCTPQDLFYLNGGTEGDRAVILVVHTAVLLRSVAPTASHLPFFTYCRKSDTIKVLIDRISTMNDIKDIASLQLRVPDHRMISFPTGESSPYDFIVEHFRSYNDASFGEGFASSESLKEHGAETLRIPLPAVYLTCADVNKSVRADAEVTAKIGMKRRHSGIRIS